jgi:hypothetical protein
LLSLRVPEIPCVLELNGLLIVPQSEPGWSAADSKPATTIVTPAALQLLLEMHDPFPWLEHGTALEQYGFHPPSRRAWLEAAARVARADLLRTPGFMSKSPPAVEAALARAEEVVSRLARGEAAEGALEPLNPRLGPRAAAYYRDGYDGLAARGGRLYSRAMEMLRDD